MADGEDIESSMDKQFDDNEGGKPDKMFTLKKWNAVAMWSWDVECDICAICRVQVMDMTQTEYRLQRLENVIQPNIAKLNVATCAKYVAHVQRFIPDALNMNDMSF
ncbi:RING-box protein 2-like [Anastrepha ludens]|uniref:RING-box protein 2-like n=1 Tax=Anastrepha ludens TaxID=28586 RepID=UPI0023B19B9A|nr:RING-box protein 2-like [Anastrepha ludens]